MKTGTAAGAKASRLAGGRGRGWGSRPSTWELRLSQALDPSLVRPETGEDEQAGLDGRADPVRGAGTPPHEWVWLLSGPKARPGHSEDRSQEGRATRRSTLGQPGDMNLRPNMLSSWVPAWVSKSSEEGPRVAGCTQAPEPLPSCPWPYCQFFALRDLVWVPLAYSRSLGFVIPQAEPVRRGPAPPARPPTAQEVCYRRAQQAQRDSAGWLQATQQPAEKPSSIHISAPGEKRRIAHVPNPRLAAGESQGTVSPRALSPRARWLWTVGGAPRLRFCPRWWP